MKKALFFLLLMIGLAASASPQTSFLFAVTSGSSGGGGIPSGATIDSLTSGTVTNAATMDINFSSFISSYNVIIITMSAVPITDNTTLEMLTSADGSTFDNSAGNYKWGLNFGFGYNSEASNGFTSFMQLAGAAGGGTGQHTDYTFVIQNPNKSANNPMITGVGAEIATGTNGMATLGFAGERLAQGIVKAVRILMSSGNITGNYKVFGMKN